jgi:hypothetical protein
MTINYSKVIKGDDLNNDYHPSEDDIHLYATSERQMNHIDGPHICVEFGTKLDNDVFSPDYHVYLTKKDILGFVDYFINLYRIMSEIYPEDK